MTRLLTRLDLASGAVVACFVALWGGFNVLNLLTYNFTHTTQDQAIFLQVLHSIVHHGDFAESVYHSATFLQAHFSPIYLLLAPLGLVLPARWLVAVFPLLPLLACGLLAHHLIERATGSRGLARLGLVASLFNPLTVHLVEQGIRETLVAMLFLALAIRAFEQRHQTSFVIFCILASLCKEDVPLILVGFLLPAVVGRRRGLWLWFPPLYGAAAFAVIVQVVMPRWGAVRGQAGLGFPFFQAMGSSYPEVALHVLTHPKQILFALSEESNRLFFRELLGSLWYLPLAAPELLLAPLSQYLEIGLSASRHVAKIHNWYYAPIYPFLVAAFARAIARADGFAGRIASKTGYPRPRVFGHVVVGVALGSVLTVSGALTAGRMMSMPLCFRGLVRHDATAGGAERLYLYLYYLKHLAFFREWTERVDHQLGRIPGNAPVSAQYPFLIRLAWRDHITLFPDVDGAEFVVAHGSLWAYPARTEDEFQEAVWSLPRQGFHLAVQAGGLMLFERARQAGSDAVGSPSGACLEDCWRYEAVTLPGSQEVSRTATMAACVLHDRVDRSAAALAVRSSWWGVDVPIGGWVLPLAPGRHVIGFWIRVRDALPTSRFLLRLAIIDDETGEEVAMHALHREQVALDKGYQRYDLVVKIPGPMRRSVQIRVEDPHRASFFIDMVDVRRQPPRGDE